MLHDACQMFVTLRKHICVNHSKSLVSTREMRKNLKTVDWFVPHVVMRSELIRCGMPIDKFILCSPCCALS